VEPLAEKEMALRAENIMDRAIFLDRDGVINCKAPEGRYVTRWEDFHFLPGAWEGIKQLKRAGFHVIVVTNQRCVAKGLITEMELEDLHRKMIDELAKVGTTIDAIYYCPHELEPPCDYRKPSPGMLLEAARLRNLDLASSWMIGDSDADILAGKNAGCRTVRVSAEEPKARETESDGSAACRADVLAASLLEAVPPILGLETPERKSKV
jgi:D-glycero-D-manno-heptose 1,7-bisphosphate phosphatase